MEAETSRALVPYTPPSPHWRGKALLAGAFLITGAIGGLASGFVLSVLRPAPTETADTHQLWATLAQLTSEVTDAKNDVDAMQAAIKAGFAKLDQPAGRDNARLVRVSDAVERLEKLLRSETTASIPPAAKQQAVVPPPVPDRLAPIGGWVLRDAASGRALLENKGDVYEAVPGADLPGAGRVQAIRRQEGRWVVVTDRGIIRSTR